jgi:hypothetical protein
MRAWQDIDKLLEPEDGLDGTLAGLRAALRVLLESYSLVDLPDTKVAWTVQNDATQVRAVEALCRHLDAAMAEVARSDFAAGTSRIYRPEAGPLPLRKYAGQHPLRSGSGPSPRPVMGHRTVLPAREGGLGIGELWLEIAFRPYSGGQATGVNLGLWVGSPAGGNTFKDEPSALQQLIFQATGVKPTVADLAGRVPGLLRRYRDGMVEVLNRTRVRLADTGRYPNMAPRIQLVGWGPMLHLCDTADLLGEEINRNTAVANYKQILGDVLEAFLEADPDPPMMQLLGEFAAPVWFPE